MKQFRNREDSLRFGLSLFLLIGSIAGTIFCNRMDEEMKGELLNLERSMISTSILQSLDLEELYFRVFWCRLREIVFLLLLSATKAAYFGFLIASAVLGFFAAVLVSSMTMRRGIFGLIEFLSFVFPQAVIYLGEFYILAWWMPVRRKGFTWSLAALFLCTTIVGALMESFLNPWIVALVVNM